jgi:predicted nucleic acid-binding protein
MAYSLADFQGEVIYLDTNVLVGLVDAESEYHAACAAFFQRVDEVTFVLLQEMLVREPYNITRSRSQYLRDHPDVVRVLMEQIAPLIEAICDLVTLESVTAADIDQMRQEMQASGSLPRDAIHLAVMKRLGLTAVASDDAGFDNRQDITFFQP